MTVSRTVSRTVDRTVGRTVGSGAGGGSGVTVPFLEGLELFLDAENLTGYSDTDPIDTWADSSENGYDATATSTARPLYVADKGNGQASVRFDGVNDYMTLGTPFAMDDELTIFAMVSRSDVSTVAKRQTIIGQSNTSNAVSLELELKMVNGLIPGVFTFETENLEEIRADELELVTYRKDGSGSGNRTVRQNGLPQELTTDTTDSYSASGTMEIGRRGLVSFQQYLGGDLSALLIYNRALTDAEILQVENYLGARYQSHLGQHYWYERQGVGALPSLGVIQGVCVDDNSDLWVMHGVTGVSATLTKLNETADDTYTTNTSYDIYADLPAGSTQQNSITFYNGSIWAGVNNFPTTPGVSKVQEYNLSGVLQATHDTGADWSEGGAWKDDEFFQVHHDKLEIRRYNSSLALQGTHALGDMGVPDTTDHLAQGALWIGDLILTPHHDGGLEKKIYVYDWTGSGFDRESRQFAAIGTDGIETEIMAQGLCTRTPEATITVGDEILIAKRGSPNTDSFIVRTVLRQRYGSKNWT